MQKDNFKNIWKKFITKKNSKGYFIFTLIFLIVCVYFLSRFILFIESRSGVILDDPLFHYFEAIDLNIPIFALIYGSLISCIIYLFLNYPERTLIAFQSYSLLVIIRMIMMYVVPLEPPTGTLDLQDPLVFIVGTGTKITKDLFFSGHTSILFLMFLLVQNKKFKRLLLLNTILVGLFVILQKAHYSIDVFVAPFISFTVFKIVLYINQKYFLKIKLKK